MFKQLRNKFLILNITIITVVMLTAFVAIYLVTYARIQTENKSKLDTGWITSQSFSPNYEEVSSLQVTIHNIAIGDSISFMVEVDENGEIVTVNSLIDMTDDAYKKAVEQAWSEQNNYSVIKLDSRDWMYVIQESGMTQVMREDGKQITVSSDDHKQIVFLDVTESNKTLFYLLVTFLVVGFFMLFVITAISLYFTDRAIRPIREAWDKQKQFVTDASHELKTPLAIINANADALLANEEDTIKSQRKWLNYMRSEISRMGKLIGDLLYLAKIEDAQETGIVVSFDISQMVNDMILSMEAMIFEKNVNLTYEIAPDILFKGNEAEIRRVLVILFDNAVKYTNQSGSIHLMLSLGRHQIEFRIRNTCQEIPNDELSLLFDRFYRTDPSRNSETGGYGLGLPIAKEMVEKAGGKIFAESEGQSVTFGFTLRESSVK